MTDKKDSKKQAAAAAGSQGGHEDNKEELAKIKKQAEEYLDGWKRAKADYINFKKEVEQRQKELLQMATAGMVFKMLPIYDSFKKALKYIPENQKKENWAVGIWGIKNQFDDFLKQLNLEEIKTVGEKFNPERHEAVGRRKEEGAPADKILEEVSSGFLSEGKVLIPAKVIVSE